MSNYEVKRRAYTSHLITAVNKLKGKLAEETLDENKIDALLEKVSIKYQRVEEMSNLLQEGMEEEALEADIAKMDELENLVIDMKTEAKSVLTKLRNPTPVKNEARTTAPVTPVQPAPVSVKLPDVSLPEFNGDEESFPSFMDQFTALIDHNPHLSEVEKFGYLKGAVKVDIIKYFPLTAQNYKAALNRLKEEYGDEDIIEKKHLHALLDMSKRKTPSNNKELQEFYNFLESKFACLEALGKPVADSNEMLITLMYRKLPKTLKSQVAQKDTISSVMEVIKNHIKTSKRMEHREESDEESEDPTTKAARNMHHKYNVFKESDDEEIPPTSSASSLPVLTQRKRNCVFCNESHPPSYCHNVVDITQRKEILKRANRCYNCLANGHRINDCRNEGRCRSCQGKHHTSICTPNRGIQSYQQRTQPGNQNAANRAPSSTANQSLSVTSSWEPIGSVLLEIAQAEVKKPGGNEYLPINIFFDKGSQLSYCTAKIRDKLKLDTVHRDVMETNTFGSTESRVSTSDVVTLQILKENFHTELNVHVSEHICNPLPSFKISRRQMQELRGITLASQNCKENGSHEIDLLIGSDLYWQLVDDKTLKTSWGAGAVKTKLGWLLSGPMSNKPNISTNVHFTTSTVIKSLQLDEFYLDKQYINQALTSVPDYEILDKLETICFESDHHRSPKTTKEKKSPENITSSLTALSCSNNIQQKYSTEASAFHDIPVIEHWFQYKHQLSLSESQVELSWFWATEHIGIMPEENEISAQQKFIQSIKYDKQDKRYEVEFPVKIDKLETLPDNRHLCEIRLESLLHKLNKPGNEDMRNCYNMIIIKQLEDGVIEEVRPTLDKFTSTAIHYLPHHGVMKKESSSLRIVYDGSAKANKKSLSLNQCLEAGPSLVNNLAAVLMRFRMFPVAVVADISKAFLQLSLNVDDRDLTRFLWKENGFIDNQLKIFRFTRVPFGLTSSPFLLHATIIHHLSQHKDKYPEIVMKMLESFYVDDMMSGADDEEQAIELANQSYNLMNEASMQLSKWLTNFPQVLQNSNIPQEKQSVEQNVKVLGVLWNTISDEFQYKMQTIIELSENLKPTKRSVLRIVQKIYDPLGILAPFLIKFKVLLQDICRLDLTWDELLPIAERQKWESWIQEFSKLENFKVPRCIRLFPHAALELIGFSDASNTSYAAVVYLRTVATDITVSLMIAKSRVSPMTKPTIPRLELLGAVLLARLMCLVKESLRSWKFVKTTYYTDSLNVLYWIKGPKKWNRYISKRISEVNSLTNKEEWFHCEGKENPADLPTRGMTVDQLQTSKLWLHGPQWLLNHTYNDTGNSDAPIPTQECLQEVLKPIHAHSVTEITGLNKAIDLKQFNRFTHLIRITAHVYYFVKNHVQRIEVSLTEMQTYAELQWIKNQQAIYYRNVILYLKGEIKKPVSIAKQLDLFLDEEGVIRCSGRYKYANLTYNIKYPILLAKHSHLTTLIIKDRHRRVHHAGIKATLNEIRADFWIPQVKRTVQDIVRRCIVCRRFTAMPFNPPGPPPLPPIRLSEMPPFTNTGVDYAGPLFCKERGRKEANKSYISLYTCASTRAVHLELVPDMTAVSFKNSMIRFVSTRGIPHVMISDNAKTFKKTAEDLNCSITRSPTEEFIHDNKIMWLFYLERSPWWGGFIERMVQSVKSVLRKILYRTFLSYDEMVTVLKQIESVVNSRPITHMFNEIDEALTPSHLLIGKRSTQLPTSTMYINDLDQTNKYREEIVNLFIRRWKEEYLSELQNYHITMQKSHSVDVEPQIGEIVIMKEDSPRSTWKLARIENIYKGRDEKIRSIQVKKPNGEYARRPPQLLIPLECKSYKQ